MLAIQKKFVAYLQELDKILGDEEISYDKTLIDRITNTELAVPVVGIFSVGKSSLLNDVIGNDVLPVGIAPETELATELRYSPESHLIAVHKDGVEERLPVDALRSNDWKNSDCSHLRLYYDSDSLKHLEPFVLVDMPGYGSSLENHNQAIAYYLPRGVHFVVVNSVESGTLSQSELRNMEELERYGTGFSCVLSKCNLRSPQQVDEVRAHIDDQLGVYFDEKLKSVPIGLHEGKRFVEILNGLDPNAIFSDLFVDMLKDQSFDLLDQINLAISTLHKDDAENERTAQALQQALDELQGEREDTSRRIQAQYSGRLVDRALKHVNQSLNSALEELTDYALSGNSTLLGNAVTDIVRSSLTESIQNEVGNINQEMINGLSAKLSGIELTNTESDSDWNEALSGRVKAGMERSSGILGDWSNRIHEHLQSKQQEATGTNAQNRVMLYRAVSTTLAVTTTIVNPLIELAIIFLPDIIKLFKQGQERDKMKQRLQTEVFPTLKARLRTELPAIAQKQLAKELEGINDQFEMQIKKQQRIIEENRLKQEEGANAKEIRIQELETLQQRIKALADHYLYA